MLQPTVRRTWWPRGQTPIQYAWDAHGRLSVLSALTLSPTGKRLGLLFDVWGHNITVAEVLVMLRSLQRRFPKGYILMLDRSSPHRSAIKQLAGKASGRIEVEWLPPYSPTLNPVERVWGHSKHDELANFVPENLEHLRYEMENALVRTQCEQTLLRSFFAWANLKI
jgi:DDE superfamily endonuclease